MNIISKIYSHNRKEYVYTPDPKGVGGSFTESNVSSKIEYFILETDGVELSGIWTSRESLESDLKRIQYASRHASSINQKQS